MFEEVLCNQLPSFPSEISYGMRFLVFQIPCVSFTDKGIERIEITAPCNW